MKVLLVFSLLVAGRFCGAQEAETSTSVFDELFGNTTGCDDTCLNSFPLHTYEQPNNQEACKRGCRLFTICEWAYDDNDFKTTLGECSSSCDEAYNGTEVEVTSCKLGCKSAVAPAKKRRLSLQEDSPHIHILGEKNSSPFQDEEDPFDSVFSQMMRNPFRMSPDSMMRSMFSYMSNLMHADFLETSIISSLNGGNGEIMIIQINGPEINTQYPADKPLKQNTIGNKIHSKTTLVDRIIESNLQTNEYQRNRPFTNDYWFVDYDLDFEPYRSPTYRDQLEEWWNCFTKKAGLPELVLLLFWISTMILLCMCCCMQFPQKKSSTLSVKGDLAYIKEVKGRLPEFLKVYGHTDVVRFTEVKAIRPDEKIPLSSSF